MSRAIDCRIWSMPSRRPSTFRSTFSTQPPCAGEGIAPGTRWCAYFHSSMQRSINRDSRSRPFLNSYIGRTPEIERRWPTSSPYPEDPFSHARSVVQATTIAGVLKFLELPILRKRIIHEKNVEVVGKPCGRENEKMGLFEDMVQIAGSLMGRPASRGRRGYSTNEITTSAQLQTM